MEGLHNVINDFIDMFTTRDFAIITWIVLALAFCFAYSKTRNKVKTFFRFCLSQMNNKLFLILSGYFVAVSFAFYFLGKAFGDWDYYMVKDAALWFLFSGLPINIRYIKEKKYFGQLKDTVLDNFKVALLFDCVFSTYTFSYQAEMLLVLVVVALGYKLTVTEAKKDYGFINSVLSTILVALGFCGILYVGYATWMHPSEIFSKLIVTELSMPFFYTCCFIASAIAFKTVLKDNTNIANEKVFVAKRKCPSDNGEDNALVTCDYTYIIKKYINNIDNFDLMEFFFKKNKYVFKKLCEKVMLNLL